jgi:MYM-type Zinc finger with FCS sequence motif.
MYFLRFLVFIILIYLLYKLFKVTRQLKLAKIKNYHFPSSSASGEDLVEDTACHTYIPLSQAYRKEISGNTHYFCSKRCCEKYELEKNM